MARESRDSQNNPQNELRELLNTNNCETEQHAPLDFNEMLLPMDCQENEVSHFDKRMMVNSTKI